MPLIADTHSQPEWENGYLLAGTLKVTNGVTNLYISGNWLYSNCPQGLVILTSSRTTEYLSTFTIDSYASGKTLIKFQLYNTIDGTINSTIDDIIIDYLIWVNDTQTRFVPTPSTETITI